MESKRKTSSAQPPKTTNMWQEILREAMPKKQIENTNVFVFGDKSTGKRSLFNVMNRSIFTDGDDSYKRLLQIDEESSRFGLLDYTYLNVKDNSEDNPEVIGKLSVWIMNDFIDKDKILTFLKPEDIIHGICLIVVDLSRPWLLKKSLEKWIKFVQEVFAQLISKLPDDKQEEVKQNVIDKIKLYQEPEIDEQGKYIKKKMEEEEMKDLLNSSLNEGVLNTNCGIPIVFVINKSDVVNQSSEKKAFEKNSEFILSHVRCMAMEYGATTVYTSGKANFNVNLLYDYICHILFNFDFTHKTNLADKEAYFIPAGFDSPALLALNKVYNDSIGQSYEETIPPIVSKTEPEEDIQCEDTNTFFESLKKSGMKGKETKVSEYFSENKKANIEAADMRNFETNIPMARNPISLDEKDKKYADTKKALKDKLDSKSKLAIKKENKDKTVDDEKKRKIREEMLAKIGKAKAKKQAEKGENK